MKSWNEILSNQVLVSAVAGWIVAQVLKTMLDFALNRTINWERMVGSGGMPSSHSATVCGLTTAAALHYGAVSYTHLAEPLCRYFTVRISGNHLLFY